MRIETFGVIGAGAVAQAVARHALNVGHKVTLSNGRGPETLEPLIHELGPGASAGTVAEAAQADAVLLAVPWPRVPRALSGLPPWDGRILIDATNHFLTGPPQFEVADLGERARRRGRGRPGPRRPCDQGFQHAPRPAPRGRPPARGGPPGAVPGR